MTTDIYKALILSVEGTEKVNLSFNKSRLPTIVKHIKLGFQPYGHIRKENFSANTEYKKMKYNDYLKADTAFRNPYSLEQMQKTFSINGGGTFLPRAEFHPYDYWDNLRALQDKGWAHETYEY